MCCIVPGWYGSRISKQYSVLGRRILWHLLHDFLLGAEAGPQGFNPSQPVQDEEKIAHHQVAEAHQVSRVLIRLVLDAA